MCVCAGWSEPLVGTHITLLEISRCGSIIGITHVFFMHEHLLGPEDAVFNTRPIGRVFKHLPRDPASVNSMNQTFAIVILAYFTLFQPNSH